MTSIKTASAIDEDDVIAVLLLAFSTDPGARWTWPDPEQYIEHFPAFVRSFGGKSFEQGSAYCVEGYGGAALWLPPGVEPDEEAMEALFERSASKEIQKDLAEVFEKMAVFHPKEPHWYLPLIGVDPFLQNRGFGSSLMKHALKRCDEENKFAFLESTNPRNIPLYERHGFAVQGKVQVGTSPQIVPMLRKPQK